MAVNKVIYGTKTLVDLTSDTITADKLLKGYTAHDASGNIIEGSFDVGDHAHPVGSYCLLGVPTDPSTLFGGTWIRKKGIFLFAADDDHLPGSTGGEENHVLTSNEMASHYHSTPATSVTSHTENAAHNHDQYGKPSGWEASGYGLTGAAAFANRVMVSDGYDGVTTGPERSNHAHVVDIPAMNTTSSGSGKAHNNMPPYEACYIWYRIA